jgi:hypothetical protein
MKDETLRKVLKLVEGANEAEASMIQNALLRGSRVRREVKTQEALLQIKPGDVIRLRGMKPKYLDQTRCTVLDSLPSEGKFRVEMINPDPRALRRWNRIVTLPASCVIRLDRDNEVEA